VQGYSHSLSGLVAGTAAGEILHLPVPGTAALAGLTAGMALLPDLDCVNGCAARSLGLISEAVAWVIRTLSGGHRHATHSFAGIAVFTGLAYLACAFRSDDAGKAGLALLLTLAVAGALEALHAARGHAGDVAGAAVAAGVIWSGRGLVLIPLAVALGCAVHIAGDMLTREGCPLAYPFTKAHQFLLPPAMRFTTGHIAERFAVDPLLFAALSVLAAQAADPALAPAVLHAVAASL
jgi:membrane-bound metal-dependent hydrolase YbcI (DUF457 family)